MKRFLAVALLALLAPLVAEALVGDVPLSVEGVVIFVSLLPIYAGGAILIREIAARSGCGWAGILTLGAAYGLVEEGIGLRSFFDPKMDGDLAGWGARLLDVNGTYAEVQLINHSIWSIAIPILLVDLVFPDLRGKALLGRAGLTGHTAAGFAITPRAVDLAIWSAIATALLMLLGRPGLAPRPQVDPGMRGGV